jgi:hypothetical protein
MGLIVVVLLVALVLAAAVILYVAYPYRGEQTPLTPLIGEAMRRGVDSLPTLDPERANAESVSITQDRVGATR